MRSDLYLYETPVFDFDYEEKPLVIRLINKLISSPLGVLILSALACISFAFAMDFVFYCFVLVYGIYVAIFADDLSPLMPLFILCYISPSPANNPGTEEGSVFYGSSGAFLLAFLTVALIIVFTRVGKDIHMGFDRLFLQKRTQTFGIVLLGAAYMLSGITTEHYSEYALRNLFFSFLQFMSIFILYYVFGGTVRWDKFKIKYFAAIGLCMGFVIIFELIWLYVNNGVIADGSIVRDNIVTGWGTRNNLGVIIVMSIPFPFCFAVESKHPSVWLFVSLLLFGGVVMTCSRASILFAVPIFVISYIAAYKAVVFEIEFKIASLLFIIIAIALAVVFKERIFALFENVPGIFRNVNGVWEFDDRERFAWYKYGIEVFEKSPIFGHTFYPVGYTIYDHAELEVFSNFFPPRYHNTIIQILASAGIVGMAAYIIHRISTVALFVSNRDSKWKIFMGISVLALLGTSMLDCHFFNIGPTLFYSMILAVAEFADD